MAARGGGEEDEFLEVEGREEARSWLGLAVVVWRCSMRAELEDGSRKGNRVEQGTGIYNNIVL